MYLQFYKFETYYRVTKERGRSSTLLSSVWLLWIIITASCAELVLHDL